MQKPPKKRILVSLWAFPISGITALVALFLRKFVNLPLGDVSEWANSVASRYYLIAQYLYILAYVVAFFGFWALYVYLAQRQKERIAFWGLMGTLLGTGLPPMPGHLFQRTVRVAKDFKRHAITQKSSSEPPYRRCLFYIDCDKFLNPKFIPK